MYVPVRTLDWKHGDVNTAHPQTDDAAPGTIISGRYCVERELGAGGFATVFLCTHLELASLEVAVKVLRHAHKRRTRIIEGFRREAALLAMLRNRNTVRLIDFGLTDDERTFLAMEYVRGTALDELIEDTGPLSVADAARVGIGVLKSLVEAHAVGVIHQDLKPANIIMVNEPGEPFAAPRVLDFGIARVLGDKDPAGETSKDIPDTIFCTPAYAPPELLRGKPDYRTDLYSLGLVLAEMIEGQPPYDFEGITASRSPHLEKAPVPFGKLAMEGPLAPVIRKACAKRVRHRYESAAAMLEDLQLAYASLTPAWRNDSRIVVDDSPEAERKARKKAPGATSQFVETQTWHIANSTAEEDDSGLIALEDANRPRSFAQTDVVANPLQANARDAALQRGMRSALTSDEATPGALLPSDAPHPDSPLARAQAAEAARQQAEAERERAEAEQENARRAAEAREAQAAATRRAIQQHAEAQAASARAEAERRAAVERAEAHRRAQADAAPRADVTPDTGIDPLANEMEARRRAAEASVQMRAAEQRANIRRAAEGQSGLIALSGSGPAPPVPLDDAAAPARRLDHGAGVDGELPISQAREVPLFGSRVSSSPVSWAGVVVVVMAILVPALITAWSVQRFFKEQPSQEQVVPVEQE